MSVYQTDTYRGLFRGLGEGNVAASLCIQDYVEESGESSAMIAESRGAVLIRRSDIWRFGIGSGSGGPGPRAVAGLRRAVIPRRLHLEHAMTATITADAHARLVAELDAEYLAACRRLRVYQHENRTRLGCPKVKRRAAELDRVAKDAEERLFKARVGE